MGEDGLRRPRGGDRRVLYWVTNPLWVGGSLAFTATVAWNDNLFSVGADGSVGDYVFKLLFIWISIGVAIVSLKRGKWIPNVGALMRVIVLGFFTLTLVIYAMDQGCTGSGCATSGRPRPCSSPSCRCCCSTTWARAAERRRRGDGRPQRDMSIA